MRLDFLSKEVRVNGNRPKKLMLSDDWRFFAETSPTLTRGGARSLS